MAFLAWIFERICNMFNNHKYSDLKKELDELKKELDAVKNVDFRLEVAKLRTEIISLRGFVNRKFSLLTEFEEAETSKNNDGFDKLRF